MIFQLRTSDCDRTVNIACTHTHIHVATLGETYTRSEQKSFWEMGKWANVRFLLTCHMKTKTHRVLSIQFEYSSEFSVLLSEDVFVVHSTVAAAAGGGGIVVKIFYSLLFFSLLLFRAYSSIHI